MTSSLVLTDAMLAISFFLILFLETCINEYKNIRNTIVLEACECLECDRASIWLFDKDNDELWTKVGKGIDKPIRIKIGQGIAGYVA